MIPHKSKVLFKSQNEIFYIMNYGIFNRLLIYIRFVPDTKFFHVDEIKQVFVFECTDGDSQVITNKPLYREMMLKQQ